MISFSCTLSDSRYLVFQKEVIVFGTGSGSSIGVRRIILGGALMGFVLIESSSAIDLPGLHL